MDFQNITVIVNPAAANGNGHIEWLRLQAHFEETFADRDITVIETESREHTVLVGKTAEADLLITFAGDGGVSDVAQGMMARPQEDRPCLAVVPLGSGNDFAKALGIPMNPWLAISRLPRGDRSLIDIGCVNDRYFLNTLSFGIDAIIADRTTELRRNTRRRGFMLYAQAAVMSIFTDRKSNLYKMTIDGKYLERNLLICAVQNGPYYGGGFKISPRALLDDGFLNICMAKNTSAPAALYYMTRIAQGTHESLKIIETDKASRLSFDFVSPIVAQCDGEKIEGELIDENTWHFDVKLIPQALEVVSMR